MPLILNEVLSSLPVGKGFLSCSGIILHQAITVFGCEKVPTEACTLKAQEVAALW